jgi:hydrogenase/urease accessory protein HupE
VIAVMRPLVFVLLALAGSTAMAHEMTMAEMELRETQPGEFVWQWTASGNNPASEELTPRWPQECHSEENVLRCGGAGLSGVLGMEGVGERYSAAMVKVFWRDGQSRVYTLTERQPSVHLYGSADDKRGLGEIAQAYLLLGIEHILSGIDHLLFVGALLFLVGFQRRLVWTITAFTLAHSLTLASAALGWLTLRSAPVEATIALSIVLVAGEALHRRETLSRRWPALVAFVFGLVHGLGFAGALAEIGLPQNHLAAALLTFNLGVELGQLLAVAVAWAAWRLARDWSPAARTRVPLLYGIGTLAAYWSWARIATVLS